MAILELPFLKKHLFGVRLAVGSLQIESNLCNVKMPLHPVTCVEERKLKLGILQLKAVILVVTLRDMYMNL